MANLIDLYSETNFDTIQQLDTDTTSISQSFTGNGANIGSAVFYLKKFGAPTGTATVSIFAHTGTYGTSSNPTGSALATSDTFNVSTLTTSTWQLITFNFTGANQIALASGTRYCVVLQYSSATTSNYVYAGYDTTSPTHAGNMSRIVTGAWQTQSTRDLCFYVYDNASGTPPAAAATPTATAFSTSVTSMAVNMPATVTSGDRLIASVSVRNSGTWSTIPTGFTQLAQQLGGGSASQLTVFEKIADGTEGGTTKTWVVSAATTAEWQVIRVTGTHASSASEVATSSGDATAADPPSLTPSWGADNTLWLAVAGHAAASAAAFSASPAGFLSFQNNGTSSGGSAVSLASAWLQLNTATEDPGAFTVGGSNRFWAAATVAIRPVASSISAFVTQTAATVTATGGTQVVSAAISTSVTQAAATVTATGGTQTVAATIPSGGTQTLTVAGDGATTSGWGAEGGTYTRLQSDDGDTTRLYSPTSGDIRQVTLTATSGLSGATINSVTVYAKFRSLDPVSNTFQIGVRTGSTDYWSSNQDTVSSTAYILFNNVWTTNPNTGLAWTVSDLDSLQVGVKKTNAAGGAVTYMYVVVDYSTSSASASITQLAGTVTASGGTQAVTASAITNASITQVAATVTASGGTQATAAIVSTSVTQVAATVTASGGTQTNATVNNVAISQAAGTVTASGGTQAIATANFVAITQTAATMTATGGTQAVAAKIAVAIAQTAATVTVAGGTQAIATVRNSAIAQVAATVTATGGTQADTAIQNSSITQVAGTVTASGGTAAVVATVVASVAQVAATVTATGGTQTSAAIRNVAIAQVAGSVTATGGTQITAGLTSVAIAQQAASVTATGGTQATVGHSSITITQVAATVTVSGGVQAAGVAAGVAQVGATVTVSGGNQSVSVFYIPFDELSIKSKADTLHISSKADTLIIKSYSDSLTIKSTGDSLTASSTDELLTIRSYTDDLAICSYEDSLVVR